MIKTYVIDTNVLIQAPYALHRFEENQVILPVVVLEELDHLKKADGEKGANARTAIRILENLRQKGDLLAGVPLENGGSLRVEKNFVDVELPPDLRFRNRSPGNGDVFRRGKIKFQRPAKIGRVK